MPTSLTASFASAKEAGKDAYVHTNMNNRFCLMPACQNVSSHAIESLLGASVFIPLLEVIVTGKDPNTLSIGSDWGIFALDCR